MTRLASQQASSFYFGGGGGPIDEYSGSTMVFIQSTAPTGWTKITDYDDYALRVVSGAAGSGGSRSFSSTFTSYTYPGNSTAFPVSISFSPATISTSQMYPHTHPVSMYPANTTSTTSTATPAGPSKILMISTGLTGLESGGTGGSHTHTGMVGSVVTINGATQPAININVKYVDAILATRD